MSDEQRIVVITSPGIGRHVRALCRCSSRRRRLPSASFVLVLPPGFDTADPPRVAMKAVGDEIRAILREHRLNPAGVVYEIGELAERLGSVP